MYVPRAKRQHGNTRQSTDLSPEPQRRESRPARDSGRSNDRPRGRKPAAMVYVPKGRRDPQRLLKPESSPGLEAAAADMDCEESANRWSKDYDLAQSAEAVNGGGLVVDKTIDDKDDGSVVDIQKKKKKHRQRKEDRLSNSRSRKGGSRSRKNSAGDKEHKSRDRKHRTKKVERRSRSHDPESSGDIQNDSPSPLPPLPLPVFTPVLKGQALDSRIPVEPALTGSPLTSGSAKQVWTKDGTDSPNIHNNQILDSAQSSAIFSTNPDKVLSQGEDGPVIGSAACSESIQNDFSKDLNRDSNNLGLSNEIPVFCQDDMDLSGMACCPTLGQLTTTSKSSDNLQSSVDSSSNLAAIQSAAVPANAFPATTSLSLSPQLKPVTLEQAESTSEKESDLESEIENTGQNMDSDSLDRCLKQSDAKQDGSSRSSQEAATNLDSGRRTIVSESQSQNASTEVPHDIDAKLDFEQDMEEVSDLPNQLDLQLEGKDQCNVSGDLDHKSATDPDVNVSRDSELNIHATASMLQPAAAMDKVVDTVSNNPENLIPVELQVVTASAENPGSGSERFQEEDVVSEETPESTTLAMVPADNPRSPNCEPTNGICSGSMDQSSPGPGPDEEESWDTLFNDDGDALDSKLMDEVSKMI